MSLVKTVATAGRQLMAWQLLLQQQSSIQPLRA